MEIGFVEQCSRSNTSELMILSVDQVLRLSGLLVEDIEESVFLSREKRFLTQEVVCRSLHVPRSHVLTAGNKQSDYGRSLVVKTNMDYWRPSSKDPIDFMDQMLKSENTKMDRISSIRDNSQFKSVDKVVIDFSFSTDSFKELKNLKLVRSIRSYREFKRARNFGGNRHILMINRVGENQVVTSVQTVSVLKLDMDIKCSIILYARDEEWLTGMTEDNQLLLVRVNQHSWLKVERETEDSIIFLSIKDHKSKRFNCLC